MNEREREHAPYHERRLEQQQLDALLRIEELLGMLLSAVQDKGPLEDDRSASMMTSAEITEKRTKGKRK
jgi:hypothetical protein